MPGTILGTRAIAQRGAAATDPEDCAICLEVGACTSKYGPSLQPPQTSPSNQDPDGVIWVHFCRIAAKNAVQEVTSQAAKKSDIDLKEPVPCLR